MHADIKKKILTCLFLLVSFSIAKANKLKLVIHFDKFASETSWNIKNSQNTIIASGRGYSSNLNEKIHTEFIHLVPGSYIFTILDSSRDGICCGQYGDGHYSLVDEKGHSLVAGGPFKDSEITNFIVGSTNPQTIFVPNPDVAWYFNASDFITTASSATYVHPSNDTNYLANITTVSGYYGNCRALDRIGNQEALDNKCTPNAPSPLVTEKSFFGTHVPKSGATVTFWVLLNSHHDNTELLHSILGDQNNDKIFEFGIDESTFTYYKQKYKTATPSSKTYKYVLAEPFTIPELNKWYFVAMTFDPFFTRIYIAEQSRGDFKCHYWWDGFYNHPDWNTSSKWKWYINSLSNSSAFMDDVMVWYGHKLSKIQIDALFNCQKYGISQNCLGDIPVPPSTIITTKLAAPINNNIEIDNKKRETKEKEKEKMNLTVYPNSTDSDFIAQFNLQFSGYVNLELFDLSGQIIFKETKFMKAGNNQIQMYNVMSSCNCSKGNDIVIFRISGKDFVISKKIIIK